MCDLADMLASTGVLLRFCRASDANECSIAAEIGMLERLRPDYPRARFWPATERADCPGMKLTTLQKILWSLGRPQRPVRVAHERVEPPRLMARMVEILDGGLRRGCAACACRGK